MKIDKLYQVSTVNWKEYLFLFIIYFFFKVPISFLALRYSDILYSLHHIYYSKIIFNDFSINKELSESIISLSNVSLLYTPGIFFLISLVKSLKGMIILTHCSNLLFIFLFHTLIRIKSNFQLGLIFTLIIIYMSMGTQFFYPDYLVQPIIALILLISIYSTIEDKFRYLILGFLCSLVLLLKQNIGVFTLVMVSTIIFFNSLTVNKKNNFFIIFIFFCYFIFGIIFFLITNHYFNYFYFLFPYFFFFIICFKLIYNNYYLDLYGYLTKNIFLVVGFLLFPLIIFFIMGKTIGFEKYWIFTFTIGMQDEFLPMHEYGILNLIKPLSFKNNNDSFISLTLYFVVLFPLFLNIVTTFNILKFENNINEIKKKLSVTSIGIIAIFFFFPFEDLKIPTSKIFIYLFIFSFFFSHIKIYLKFYILTSLFVIFSFLQIFYSLNNFIYFKNKTSFIKSEKFNKFINIKIEDKLVNELDYYIKSIEDQLSGKKFMLVSQDVALTPFLLLSNGLQYYLRFDDVIVNDNFINELNLKLDKTSYVIVSKKEFDLYLSQKDDSNKSFYKIINHIENNFNILQEVGYDNNNDLPDLIIFEKRN